MLLAEVERRGSVDEAVKALVESRPGALLERYRAQAFPTQSLATRIKIVLAGPLANILFAPVLMAIVFMYGVPYVKPILGEIKKGMPAYSAGLRKGDQIAAVNGAKDRELGRPFRRDQGGQRRDRSKSISRAPASERLAEPDVRAGDTDP